MAKRGVKRKAGSVGWQEVVRLDQRISALTTQVQGLELRAPRCEPEPMRMGPGFDACVTTRRIEETGCPEKPTDEKPIDWRGEFLSAARALHPGALDRIRREHERGLLGVHLCNAIAHLIEEALIARSKRL